VATIAIAIGCEFHDLIAPSEISAEQCSIHLDIVLRRHEAMVAGDIDGLMPLHTEDTILVRPGIRGSDFRPPDTCRKARSFRYLSSTPIS
jgi:hypothetical protein